MIKKIRSRRRIQEAVRLREISTVGHTAEQTVARQPRQQYTGRLPRLLGSWPRANERKPSVHPAYRSDIQGLRAVAVAIVVFDHAHVHGFGGGFVGVDVFFVISGFLITGLLLKDVRVNGRISFTDFYARRARRILPAATTVLLCTSVASVLVLNFVRAKGALTDSVWAAFFAANIHFGRGETDYFAPNNGVSPVQHFWSLAVEEQFYLIWPALMAGGLLVAAILRRRRESGAREENRATSSSSARTVFALVLLLGACSFTFSIVFTHKNQTAAYFSTFTRAWELGVGALLAVALPTFARIPEFVRASLSWAGLVGIGAAVLLIGPHTAFPGYAAALPVASAAAVIAGGTGTPRLGAPSLLGLRPARFLGDISYSLYLWHAPVLVLAAAYAGHEPSTAVNLALVLFSVLLAAVTYRAIENPFRRSSWLTSDKRSFLLWPAALASVGLLAVFVAPANPFPGTEPNVLPAPTSKQVVAAVSSAVQAAQDARPLPRAVAPKIEHVAGDFKNIGNCGAYRKTSSKLCDLGDPSGATKVVLFGDSHSTMWVPAFKSLTRRAHARFVPVLKEACGYEEYAGLGRPDQCTEWYRWAIKRIRAMRPSLIVVSAYVHPLWDAGMRVVLRDLAAAGTRVVLLSDAPGLAQPPVDCLLKNGATQRTCAAPEAEVHKVGDRTARSIAQAAGVGFVDVKPWFCQRDLCPTLVNSTVTYADGRHITGTYARYLAPTLSQALGER